MDKTVYICTGTCGAVVSQEEYDGGLTVCGTEECTLKGHPFEKRKQCAQCGSLYKEGQAHSHEAV